MSLKPWNDIVVDATGGAYVNSIGFVFPGEEPAPGIVVLVRPDGEVVPVADDLAFPNGMAITDDGGTLLVAESYAERLAAYDVASDGRLSVRRGLVRRRGRRHCVASSKGGEVMESVELDRGASARVLSRGIDPKLFVVGQDWGGPSVVGGATGQLVAFPAQAPGAGHP